MYSTTHDLPEMLEG